MRELVPSGTLAGVKDLVSAGLEVKVAVADAVPPEPALPEETAPVVLTNTPPLAEVTFTVTVQLPLAGMETPEMPRVLPPATPPEIVPPTQVVAGDGEALFTRPAG